MKRKDSVKRHFAARVLAAVMALALVLTSVVTTSFATTDSQAAPLEYMEDESVSGADEDAAAAEVSAGDETGSAEEAAADAGEAVLENEVSLTLYQDEEENSFIRIDLTVRETADVRVEDMSVKMILPAGLSVTENDLVSIGGDEDITYVASVADEVQSGLETAEEDDTYEMLLAELAGYTEEDLAAFGSAVVWMNQTAEAGSSSIYSLTVAVDEEVYDYESDGLFYVNGDAVSEENIEWNTDESIGAASAEDTDDDGQDAEEDSTPVLALEENTDTDADDEVVLTAAADSDVYDGTALKAYADELFDKYGLTLTISQSPAGGNTVESGDAVTWYVTLSIPVAENYSGFSSYNKTLYDSYDNLTVNLTAPDGITIRSVDASGYDTSIVTDENGGTAAVVNLGDVTASAQTISFTVTGYIAADPAPATGTTYLLTEDDITYSTSITVKDRDSSNAEVATYDVTGTTATDLSSFTLTSKTDDEWSLKKTQKSYSVSDGTLTVEYTIELLMNGFTQDTEYTANGRVNFKEFSIADTPTITDEDGNLYYPTSVTITNNTTAETKTGTTSVTTGSYATLDDSGLTETTATGVAIEGDVPFHTTYTVKVTYDADQFTSQFYDVKDYTMNNTAELSYTLDYADGTTPVKGTDEKTATGTYSYAADPASIDLEKYIRSIYGGGNYLTGGASLDSEYTGDAEFTILDKDGKEAELYILYDSDNDGKKEYVPISSVITISRDSNGAALYVTILSSSSSGSSGGALSAMAEAISSMVSAVGNLLTLSSNTIAYDGLLYLNGGTYSIEETNNTIDHTVFTEFTADSGVTLTPDSQNKTYSFTLTAGQAATINACNTETRGSITFNKRATDYSGGTDAGVLAGAEFGIYTDSDCTTPVRDSSGSAVTAVSDSQGIVTFTKLDPGTFYIKETKASEGYLLDTNIYKVTVTANETTTTFSDSTGTVYNKENAAALTFEKYLLSTDSDGKLVQVAVDQTRLDNVFNKDSSQVFVLQCSTDGGQTWTTLENRTFTLQRDPDTNGVMISSASLQGLPVYTDSEAGSAYLYRIVEYLPAGYSLADLSGVTDGDIDASEDSAARTVTTSSFTLENGDTTVSLTNQTTGEISVYKQYVEANTGGASTSSADGDTAVTVYLLTKNADGSYSYVDTASNSATTDSRGRATVTDVNILADGDSTVQEYYWAEATANNKYSSYKLEGGQTVTVNVNGTPTDMYLLGAAAYASAYDSTSSETTLTNILPYVRVKLSKKSSTTGAYVPGAGYTTYQLDENGNESLYVGTAAQNTAGTVAEGGSSLVLEAGYVYHIYETKVPDHYTGLTNADGSSEKGDYIIVDLTGAVPAESTDTGVLQNTYAAEAIFTDEPYPKFSLTKELVSVNGSNVSTSSYDAAFTVYRSKTEDGAYTSYAEMSTYTANTTVYLEPGYYYAFVENVASDVVSPDIYPGTGTTNTAVSGGSLKQITLESGADVYAFVTADKVTATGTATSYSIGTVTNYENTSSIKVTKYAYSGGSVKLDGADIGLYSDSSCEEKYLITHGVTIGGSVTFEDLSIYTGSNTDVKATYYIKEISAPDGYFVDDTVYTVELTPGKVSGVSIYDEQELSVSVPVIWEDCLSGQQNVLEGATVYAYEVVTDEEGSTAYVLAGSAVSGPDGYAAIGGLKHNTEYVFILGASGVTDETASNYPLYASEDGTQNYLVTTTVTTGNDGNTVVTCSDPPEKLTSLDGYQTVSYTGCTDLSQDSDTVADQLVNHLLYLQIMIQKYCTKDHGADRQVGLYDSSGNVSDKTGSGAYYVNGAQFTLYRQALTEEETEALTQGETITITYDATKLEKVENDESTDTGKADVDDTYNTAYVYWLVETATGTAHTWAGTDYYYRVLLYSDEWTGTICVENATNAQQFTANETVYLNVENTCGSGSHEYLLTTIYMNKWAGYYDEFGTDTEDYSPLSGVTFSFSLKNSKGTTVDLTSDMTDGDTAISYGDTEIVTNETTDTTVTLTYEDNDAGQMSVMFKFPLLLNEWIVAVANESGMNVTTITDITSDSNKLEKFNNITEEVWAKYEGMLYVAGVVDAADMSDLTDLAANDGAAAKRILNAYAAEYYATTISVDGNGNVTENGDKAYISGMENVLGSYYTWTDSEGNTQSLGYKSYYAHIVLTETDTTTSDTYGDYELNTTDYELYLQFRPTGSEGSANIKYFYLDNADRSDYYYDADPSGVGTKVLDESFDNTAREQIVNMPVLKKDVTITKYGYTLNASTAGKTDDALDTYFENTEGSGRIKITASFYVQRYDSTAGEWKYYDAGNGVYVDDSGRDNSIINAADSGWSGQLAIGWYRLVEISAGSGYDVVLDGTQVNIAGSSGTTEAVRYFWVKTEKGSNAVNVYDPDSIDLLIHKYSLSNVEISSGVTITLTASDGTEYTTAGWNSTKQAYVIENLPAGTYTVTETVTNTSVTDDYFQSFTITVGYDREANEEQVQLTSSSLTEVTQYATCVTGVSASISGQADCSNNSTEDSVTADNIDSSGASATLKIYNPSTGSITITKSDANNSSTKLSGAKFKLYYQKFDVDRTDAYVADTTAAPAYTSGSSEWTYIGEYTTGTNGVISVPGLTPGWYAVEETYAPDGYELNSEVQVVAVAADMAVDQNGEHTMTDNGNVSVSVTDVKKVNLSVEKIFNLNSFSSDLQDAALYYSVTFGLYVYDEVTGKYIPAIDLGLTDTGNVTVDVNNTTGTVSTEEGTWYSLIQMEEYLDNNGNYSLVKENTTYLLDGSYYIREISVTNKNTGEDVTADWWISDVSMSSGNSLSVNSTAVTDSGGYSYYKVSGFKDNATGTVTFTNDLSYATVEILKTDDAEVANPLSGATFTVYSDADCTNAIISGTTGDSGTCSIKVPVTSTTGTTFYIKETAAPTGYTLYEETITVTLGSGQKVSYTDTGSGLTIKDSNGVYVKLTKYDNIHGYSSLNTLPNVTFTLLRSTDNGATWTVQKTYTTDGAGGINFDTLKNSENTIYMLAETTYDTEAYAGLESMWYTVTSADGGTTTTEADLTEKTVSVTVNGTDRTYTGYQFSLVGIASGSTYQLYAYNQPRPKVTFIKEGDGTGAAVPTATLQIYGVDASSYTAGQTLTSDEVSAAIREGTPVDTVSTAVVSGEQYSSAVKYLSAGTYLVVETQTSDSNNDYIINKDDANEFWYRIIEVPADGTKEMEVSFVNVTQKYDVSIDKSGTASLGQDLLSGNADLSYTLDVKVTNSGPVSALTVSDSGLIATKVYSGVGSSATTVDVSAADAEKYLKGDYGITLVKIPMDAIYQYDSLVFTSGDKTGFTRNITAKVTFTYEDGTTEYQTADLADVTTTDGYWTVKPTYSSLKAVSFTVTWYDETLKTYTGYELGSSFAVSDSGKQIEVEMHIDEQEGGTADYYAVAEIRNSASVIYNYKKWDTTGYAEDSEEKDDAEALTSVPNVSAAQMEITKSVENETSTVRNSSQTAIIGDTLKYTITLTNSSSSLSMDNPILLDLLPQGVVAASAADESSYLANVKITGSTNTDSTLRITNVWRTRSDGYTLLEIVTSGRIAPGESVTITLEAVVDSTVLNYSTANASLTNNVWMTSSDQGTVYHDNAIGSVFMGNTGSWAGDYTDPTSGNIMNNLLSNLGLTGYGYISDSAAVGYAATSSVTLLKEVQGDQDVDGDNWYYGDEGGTVTANTTDAATDDGYANFRLTVTNSTDGQDLTNIVLMDIVPKEDGASFNSNIKKEWSLVFDSITSVTAEGTSVGDSHYTVWYYTGSVGTDSDVTDMQTSFITRETDTGSSWVKAADYNGDKSSITAFAVVFDSTVSLGAGHKLQIIYKATVPQMSETDASDKAHLATYNDFSVSGDLVVSSDPDIVVSSISMNSNYVYALLSTRPVGVGGMFWIDADGDGTQDSEDVISPSTYDYNTDGGGTEGNTASTYNGRTNNYSDYSVVNTLLNTASIQLLTYNGSTNSQMTPYSGTLLSASSWRFLFTDLASANISSAYTDATAYDSDGIRWSALAGASTASWYQLQATIAGNGSIRYSLTDTTLNVKSYDPDVMYSADNSSIEYKADDGSSYNALTDNNFSADNYSATDSKKTTSDTTTGSAITSGSTTAASENFFLYGTTSGNALWNLSEDIGVVIYRDLKITKKDTDGSSPASGSTFKVYGPYAKGEANAVQSLDNEHLVGTYTTTDANPTTITIDDLLYFQEYIIVETSADDSYDLDSAAAAGTNITAIKDGVTEQDGGNVTTYKAAWILNIPTSDSSYASGGKNYTQTDPTAYNDVTTDNMTVTNAKKMTIELIKIDGGGLDSNSTDEEIAKAAKLSDAVFSLYAEDDVTVTGAAVTVKSGASPLYTATSGNDGTVKFAEKITDSVTGIVTYNDEILESGTYYVIETTAPSGYELLTKNYWKVTVDTAKQTVTIDTDNSGSVFAVTDNDGNVIYYIPNYTQYTLPAANSGGRSMLKITLIGCLLMFAATGLWLLKEWERRRKRRRILRLRQ